MEPFIQVASDVWVSAPAGLFHFHEGQVHNHKALYQALRLKFWFVYQRIPPHSLECSAVGVERTKVIAAVPWI